MTRRLNRSKRVLSVDAYIHRATLGLPRDERLDAAAELRTHLLDRVAQLQGQGFARDEAEHLAVRGMGEVSATNRGLLGHALTHRVGWAVLALTLVGGGGWWTYREWLPPGEGIRYEAATLEDTQTLFALKDAPRGTYQAATLTYPQATRSVIYVQLATGGQQFVWTKNVARETAQNVSGRVPGSYRYQERWLTTAERLTCDGAPHTRLYYTAQPLASPFWNRASVSTSGVTVASQPCDNPTLGLRVLRSPDEPVGPPGTVLPPDGEGTVITTTSVPEPLRLNEWTVLRRLAVDPQADPNISRGPEGGGYGPKARGLYLAVLPLAEVVPDGAFRLSTGSSGQARLNLVQSGLDLPPLPPTVIR